MSILKMLTLTAACLFTVANLQATVTTPAQVTLEDFHKAALAFEKADNAFMNEPAAKLAMQHKKTLRMCLVNSAKSASEILSAVKKVILVPGCACAKKTTKESRAFAQNEVVRLIEECLENIKNGNIVRDANVPSEQSVFVVVNAARAYYNSLARVMKLIPEKYKQRSQAREDYKKAGLALLSQGETPENLQQEMKNAGVQNDFILKMPTRWVKK